MSTIGELLLEMLRRREAAELSYLPVHSHYRLEVVLLSKRDVDHITSVVTEVLRRADDLIGDLGIRSDSFFQQRTCSGAVPQLVSAHVTQQLRQHRLASLLSEPAEKVGGKQLGAHEVGQVRDDLVSLIGDATGFLARSDKRPLRKSGCVIAYNIQVPSERSVVLETLVQLETQDRCRVDIVPEQQHQSRPERRQIAFDHCRIAQARQNLGLVPRGTPVNCRPADAFY